MAAKKTAIAPERLAELKAQVAHMRKHPPAAGMGVTLPADEVEKLVEAVERNGYAELFALNQKQADTIDEFVRLRDEMSAYADEQREKIAALEKERDEQGATIEAQEGEIKKLKAFVRDMAASDAPPDEGPTGDDNAPNPDN